MYKTRKQYIVRKNNALICSNVPLPRYSGTPRLVPMPRSGIQIHTPHVRIPERLVQHDAFLGGVRIWYPV